MEGGGHCVLALLDEETVRNEKVSVCTFSNPPPPSGESSSSRGWYRGEHPNEIVEREIRPLGFIREHNAGI